MKPVNFDYARPKDLDASLSLLTETGRSVKVNIISGGMQAFYEYDRGQISRRELVFAGLHVPYWT